MNRKTYKLRKTKKTKKTKKSLKKTKKQMGKGIIKGYKGPATFKESYLYIPDVSKEIKVEELCNFQDHPDRMETIKQKLLATIKDYFNFKIQEKELTDNGKPIDIKTITREELLSILDKKQKSTKFNQIKIQSLHKNYHDISNFNYKTQCQKPSTFIIKNPPQPRSTFIISDNNANTFNTRSNISSQSSARIGGPSNSLFGNNYNNNS